MQQQQVQPPPRAQCSPPSIILLCCIYGSPPRPQKDVIALQCPLHSSLSSPKSPSPSLHNTLPLHPTLIMCAYLLIMTTFFHFCYILHSSPHKSKQPKLQLKWPKSHIERPNKQILQINHFDIASLEVLLMRQFYLFSFVIVYLFEATKSGNAGLLGLDLG